MVDETGGPSALTSAALSAPVPPLAAARAPALAPAAARPAASAVLGVSAPAALAASRAPASTVLGQSAPSALAASRAPTSVLGRGALAAASSEAGSPAALSPAALARPAASRLAASRARPRASSAPPTGRIDVSSGSDEDSTSPGSEDEASCGTCADPLLPEDAGCPLALCIDCCVDRTRGPECLVHAQQTCSACAAPGPPSAFTGGGLCVTCAAPRADAAEGPSDPRPRGPAVAAGSDIPAIVAAVTAALAHGAMKRRRSPGPGSGDDSDDEGGPPKKVEDILYAAARRRFRAAQCLPPDELAKLPPAALAVAPALWSRWIEAHAEGAPRTAAFRQLVDAIRDRNLAGAVVTGTEPADFTLQLVEALLDPARSRAERAEDALAHVGNRIRFLAVRRETGPQKAATWHGANVTALVVPPEDLRFVSSARTAPGPWAGTGARVRSAPRGVRGRGPRPASPGWAAGGQRRSRRQGGGAGDRVPPRHSSRRGGAGGRGPAQGQPRPAADAGARRSGA